MGTGSHYIKTPVEILLTEIGTWTYFVGVFILCSICQGCVAWKIRNCDCLRYYILKQTNVQNEPEKLRRLLADGGNRHGFTSVLLSEGLPATAFALLFTVCRERLLVRIIVMIAYCPSFRLSWQNLTYWPRKPKRQVVIASEMQNRWLKSVNQHSLWHSSVAVIGYQI